MKKLLSLAFAALWLVACTDTKTDRDKTIDADTRPDNTTTTTETVTYTPADGDVSYRDDKLMVYRNGQWVVADDDVKLENGIIVYRNGKVKKDDKEVELENGQIVDRDGDFFDESGRAIENAWDATKAGVKEAGKDIEKAAQKTGDKIEGAVDDDHDKDK